MSWLEYKDITWWEAFAVKPVSGYTFIRIRKGDDTSTRTTNGRI